MIRRPKRDDLESRSVTATLCAAAESAGEMTRDAREAYSKLARAAALLLLLQVLLLPVLTWFLFELPGWAGILAVYAASALFAATFWILFGKPEHSRRARRRRERLEACEDAAEMRSRLLSQEVSRD